MYSADCEVNPSLCLRGSILLSILTAAEADSPIKATQAKSAVAFTKAFRIAPSNLRVRLHLDE
jgi:hypothetical protein